MIDLTLQQLNIVRGLLSKHLPDCEVRAFGSRVSGKAKPYSDLDLVILASERLPLMRLASVREAFQESELSIRVDLLDWYAISAAFRSIIEARFELLQKPGLSKSQSDQLEQSIRASLKEKG